MYIYKIIILCGLLLGSVGLKAQEAQCSIDRKLRADSTNRNRIITRATMYGVGFTNVFDTYLSPQEYKGIDFRISRESMRMTRLMDCLLYTSSSDTTPCHIFQPYGATT